MSFHKFMADMIHSFVEKVSGAVLDIVYLTAAFRAEFISKDKVILSVRMYSYDHKRSFLYGCLHVTLS